ncbi:hypothetical protein DSM106972_061620 [Dulcicalothrix desertica PCC 7102]|uniref:Uncharacterized protein n=1 Tax=Dulcicalothrix desertica PCC 7102 TaxID=232991 RepID=A0A3S1AJF6_9CYAN|nr:hypothetical protein DSM106972_061620 [Dulcicalothrix desertica PCC 7102]
MYLVKRKCAVALEVLTLTLLVLGVYTNYHDATATLYDVALFANPLD